MVRFEIFRVVKIWMMVFWVMMLCSLAGGYQYFGGMYHLHAQGRMYPEVEAVSSSEILRS
jgi:hypothetical protein